MESWSGSCTLWIARTPEDESAAALSAEDLLKIAHWRQLLETAPTQTPTVLTQASQDARELAVQLRLVDMHEDAENLNQTALTLAVLADNVNGDVSITEVDAVMLEHNSDTSSESGEDLQDAAAVDAPLAAGANSDDDYCVTLDEWIAKFGDSDESIAAFHEYDTDGDDKISSGELEDFCESEKGKRMYAKANGEDVAPSALDKGSNEAGEPSSLKVVIVGDGAIGKVCIALS